MYQGRGATAHYTTVNVPGSIQTELHGINNRGKTVGVYWDSNGAQHGFMHSGRDYTKNYTMVDVSMAECCTTALGINQRGDIVGTYWAKGGLHGYMHHGRDFTKGYTSIDVPGAYETTASGINSRGVIVGQYHDASYGLHGFAMVRGVQVTMDVPTTAVPAPVPNTTQVSGINSRGVMVGDYLDTNYNYDGFVQLGTAVAPFSYNNGMITFPKAISDKGEIVGIAFDNSFTFHGFALAAPMSSGGDDDERGKGDNQRGDQGDELDGDQGGND
jgi:probable HAF family extracellular repeat protein